MAPKLLSLLFLFFLATLSFSCHGSMQRILVAVLPVKANRGQLSFEIERLPAFNFLPRGVPIPPSGPSKGHNDIGDSDATDRSEDP